jgi:AcrR family transcriptional regulator
MPRKPDPTRKPELLGQILDHLAGRTLATVSFRTLAEALGVSTYVFVYHFGNRAQLVDEIVRAVVARQDALLQVDPTSLDEEGWREFMADAWREVSSDRYLQLQRLEFEAAMLEMVDGRPEGVARSAVAKWHEFTSAWAVSRGVDPARADLEARLFTDAIYGLQYDALATGDTDRVTRAFELHVDSFARRIDSLVVTDALTRADAIGSAEALEV